MKKTGRGQGLQAGAGEAWPRPYFVSGV